MKKHKWNLRSLFFNIGLILFFTVLLSLWGFYWAIRPFRIVSANTPAQFNLPYEKIILHTADNVAIHGWFIPNKNPEANAIILLHGYPADKGDILPSRYFLHHKYHLLFIDFRYFGESEGQYSTVGKTEVLDVLAAIHFLKQKGIKKIGIWGFSLGGAVAIMAAEQSPDIKAIVAESSFANLVNLSYDYFKIPLLKYPLGMLLRFWGMLFLGYDLKKVSPMTSATHLTIPILLIHSQNDNVISFENAELIQQSLKNNPHVQLLFFHSLSHGEAPPNYQQVVSDFFAKNL